MDALFISSPTSRRRSFALAVTILPFLVAVATGQTFNNLGGDGLWSNPQNWTNEKLPDAETSANLGAMESTVDVDFTIPAVTGSTGTNTVNVNANLILTAQASMASNTNRHMQMNILGGSVAYDRFFTNATLLNATLGINIAGGTLVGTGRTLMHNTNTGTTTASSFVQSGGTVTFAGQGIHLYGTSADYRPTFSIIGSAGSWVASSVTLGNTSGDPDPASGAAVYFALGQDGVTTVKATGLRLVDNPLTIDFSNVSIGDLPLVDGLYTWTLFTYNSLAGTGGFADPVFIGTNGAPAQLVHDLSAKAFLVTVPEPPILALVFGFLAGLGVLVGRYRS